MTDRENWEAVGKLVRDRRKYLRIHSQGTAAEQAGVSLNTWQRLESGIGVGATSLSRASTLLGWDPSYLQRVLLGYSATDADALEVSVPPPPVNAADMSVADRLEALAAAFPEDLFPDNERTPEAIRVMRRTYQHAARIARGEM